MMAFSWCVVPLLFLAATTYEGPFSAFFFFFELGFFIFFSFSPSVE